MVSVGIGYLRDYNLFFEPHATKVNVTRDMDIMESWTEFTTVILIINQGRTKRPVMRDA